VFHWLKMCTGKRKSEEAEETQGKRARSRSNGVESRPVNQHASGSEDTGRRRTGNSTAHRQRRESLERRIAQTRNRTSEETRRPDPLEALQKARDELRSAIMEAMDHGQTEGAEFNGSRTSAPQRISAQQTQQSGEHHGTNNVFQASVVQPVGPVGAYELLPRRSPNQTLPQEASALSNNQPPKRNKIKVPVASLSNLSLVNIERSRMLEGLELEQVTRQSQGQNIAEQVSQNKLHGCLEAQRERETALYRVVSMDEL